MVLDFNEIIDNRLWVGGLIRPEGVILLKQIGITTILSLQSDQDLAIYDVSLKKLLRACDSAQIEFIRIPIPDFNRQALLENLPSAVAELEAALTPSRAKVYVHCTAGINRGPTLTAAYLIKIRRLSAKDAYEHVVARRHCSPYLSVLEEYEEFLKNCGSSGFADKIP